MKIAQVSPDRLVLTDRPWFFAGLIWAIGLAALWAGLTGNVEDNGLEPWVGQLFVSVIGAASCLLAWWVFPFQDIEFDRSRRSITRRIRRPLAPRVEEVPLGDLESARVGSSWSDGDRLVRLELVLVDRTWPLEWGYSSAERADIADAINAWHAGEVAARQAGPGKETMGEPIGIEARRADITQRSSIPDTRRDLP